MANLNGHEGGNAGDGQGAPTGPGEGGEAARGGGGGKAAGQGECETAKHAPDAEPGRRVQRAGTNKASSADGQGETVHCALTPRLRHRETERGVLRPEAGCGTGSGRGDVAVVRRATGRTPRGSRWTAATWSVSGEAGSAGAHPKGRRTAEAARSDDARGQAGPACARDGLNCIYETDFLGFSYGFRPGADHTTPGRALSRNRRRRR